MHPRYLCFFALVLSVGCNGSLTEPGEPEEAEGGAVNASGGFRADEASGGATSREPRQARKDTRSEDLDPSTGGTGMGGDAPVEEKPVAIPSAACSLPAAVPENRQLELAIDLGPIPISLPPDYDGATPGPIIIAIPASHDGLPELVEEDGRTPNPLLEEYVIARPRPMYSISSTWEGLTLEDYDTMYRELATHVCFDEARVIGVGNGGGGRFLVWMAGKPTIEGVVRPPEFLAMAIVGPVGNGVAPWPEVPLLFLHSTQDERGAQLWNDADGRKALEKRRESQGCQETPLPASSTVYGGATYVCSDFIGCISPLRFCNHDLPTEWDFWETRHNVELHRFFGKYL